MTDAYREDLAYIHNAGFTNFGAAAAPVLAKHLSRGGHPGGLVIDLGCGSGVLSDAVAKAGYDILGVDISEPMIAIARKRVPRGEFRVASVLSAGLPPCVGIAAVGECLNYLFDRANTATNLDRLFRRIYGALATGGVFLLDVAEPGRVPGPGPRRSYFEGADWVVLVDSDEDREKQLLTRRITTFRRVGELYRRDHEIHRQRLLSGKSVAEKLRAIGFRVRILRGYGDLRFGRGHVGLVARKP
jgi:SAM-dependent methyltransferase